MAVFSRNKAAKSLSDRGAPEGAAAAGKTAGQKSADYDEIAASQAPLLDHLVELRQRLIRSFIAFALAFLLCFAVKNYILEFLLFPYQWAIKFSGANPANMMLQSTTVLETFAAKMKIAAFGAVILAFPVMAFQLYRFIAPGLYKKERAAFLPFLCASPLLFLLGAAFVYCLIAPLLLWFSLSQQQLTPSIAIHFIARISDYLDFIISFTLIFGLIFQLPVITSLLVRVGLLTAGHLVALRKWEIVISFIIAAAVTPSDLFSMFGLALPLVLLYEISIILARRIEKRRAVRQSPVLKT
ncbi:twin-arginine translocase subunit TatC [Candidatus Tokpelaia sp.]|uniref:twin-arginine translocase subunit TatC n=1 Tax=Candidatus Tokpelaia sp. TaxID=2233777 RepID=UPI0012397CB8|nr:twin-arginine translocase subunit TatC [Candidatus Tokpelaia sp.]KAA6404865.1 twin-arginine translocase subunit TatC [Candidatus Tokpelaia sp.]